MFSERFAPEDHSHAHVLINATAPVDVCVVLEFAVKQCPEYLPELYLIFSDVCASSVNVWVMARILLLGMEGWKSYCQLPFLPKCAQQRSFLNMLSALANVRRIVIFVTIF